ncbi:MAG: DUF2087 domain-containing protein [Ignavibacteriales bacterium]
MIDVSDLFWQASLEELKQGYVFQKETGEYICLICGTTFLDGVVYPSDSQLYEARRMIGIHIEKNHRSMFHHLLNLDKKLTGLTDHQKNILELFFDGFSDSEVANALNTGSTSTIRNHRFTLREKQKQAKVFLAIMELLAERVPKKQAFIDIPSASKHVDDRFAITGQENDNVLNAYFVYGLDGPLEEYPQKEKKRIVILRHLLKNFEVDRTYTEKEVNAILKPFFTDYVMLRRHMIEYGFMDRNPDGSSYWVKTS